jgi:hypothetical protein
MFWWIVGGVVLFYVVALIFIMALCKSASDADDWTERWYEEHQRQQKIEQGEEYKWN